MFAAVTSQDVFLRSERSFFLERKESPLILSFSKMLSLRPEDCTSPFLKDSNSLVPRVSGKSFPRRLFSS